MKGRGYLMKSSNVKSISPKQGAKKVLEREFVVEKTTKNTNRYEEAPPEGEPKVIGSLYVQHFFAGKETKRVKVTVEVIE